MVILLYAAVGLISFQWQSTFAWIVVWKVKIHETLKDCLMVLDRHKMYLNIAAESSKD